MRLLLDENLDVRLKRYLPGHLVDTVSSGGWKGKKNGELLALLLAAQYDVFITADKGIQYQQNFKNYCIPVFVLRSNSLKLDSLIPLMEIVSNKLKEPLNPGPVEIRMP